MAYSSAAVPAASLAFMAGDKPLIMASNRVRGLGSAPQWRTTGSFASGSDLTDTTYPTSFLSDGFTHAKSKPNTTGATWYVIIDFGAGLVSFDSIAIIGHNFAAVGVTTVTVEVADSNSFGTSLVQLCSWSPGSSTKRLVALDLHHTGSTPLVYSSVRYGRVKMTTGGSAVKPEISELIFASRLQLHRAPNLEWDPDSRRSEFDQFRASSGVVTRYSKTIGQRLMHAELNPSDTTEQSDLLSYWATDTGYGRYPFLWVPKPTTAPQDAPLMISPALFGGPYRGPIERGFTIDAEEQGDLFVAQES